MGEKGNKGDELLKDNPDSIQENAWGAEFKRGGPTEPAATLWALAAMMSPHPSLPRRFQDCGSTFYSCVSLGFTPLGQGHHTVGNL